MSLSSAVAGLRKRYPLSTEAGLLLVTVILVLALLATAAIGYISLGWNREDVRLLLLGTGGLANALLVSAYILTLIHDRRESIKRQQQPLYRDLVNVVLDPGVAVAKKNSQIIEDVEVAYEEHDNLDELVEEMKIDMGAWGRFRQEHGDLYQMVVEHDEKLAEVNNLASQFYDEVQPSIADYVEKNEVRDEYGDPRQISLWFTQYLLNDRYDGSIPDAWNYDYYWEEHQDQLRQIRDEGASELYDEYTDQFEAYTQHLSEVRVRMVELRDSTRETYSLH